MNAGTVVLLASPLENLEWWHAAERRIDDCSVVGIAIGDRPPYGTTWVAEAAQALHTAHIESPILLVGHGISGPLLPALAGTQRAARRGIAGYVFVDATLPRPGRSNHLDLLRAADPEAADLAHRQLHAEGSVWPAKAPQPGDHDFWTAPLPTVRDWPDAPCSYLCTTNVPSPAGIGDTGFWARSAKARGWPVHIGPDVAAFVTEVLRTS